MRLNLFGSFLNTANMPNYNGVCKRMQSGYGNVFIFRAFHFIFIPCSFTLNMKKVLT